MAPGSSYQRGYTFSRHCAADVKRGAAADDVDADDLDDAAIRSEDLDSNDFAKLYELSLPTTTFCEELQLANDATDSRRVVVSKINADLSKRSGVVVGDVLIAIAGRFVPRKTPAVELSRLVRERAQATATAFRFWHVGCPSVAGSDASVTRMEGVEYAVNAARKHLGARWGRVQLRLGALNLARYFVAVRTPNGGGRGSSYFDGFADDAAGTTSSGSAGGAAYASLGTSHGTAAQKGLLRGGAQHHRRVRRGDILVGIDHEPLPILITSSDLQYRLNRGSAAQPVTLNVYRVTDPTLVQRILTCCDIADVAGGYGPGPDRGSSGSHHASGGTSSSAFARCHKCEGSSLSSACLCMI